MPDSFKSIKEIIESSSELKNIKQLIDDGDIVKDFHKIFPEFKTVVKAVKCIKQTLTLNQTIRQFGMNLNSARKKL